LPKTDTNAAPRRAPPPTHSSGFIDIDVDHDLELFDASVYGLLLDSTKRTAYLNRVDASCNKYKKTFINTLQEIEDSMASTADARREMKKKKMRLSGGPVIEAEAENPETALDPRVIAELRTARTFQEALDILRKANPEAVINILSEDVEREMRAYCSTPGRLAPFPQTRV
jgi:hypothetical protein